MIKKVYIDGLFMALSYEAKKIFIKRDDIDIKFKEGQEEKRIITLLTVLGVHEVIGDYTISISSLLINIFLASYDKAINKPSI